MKRLSKEQIQFIDNYLEHSDVFYADIRMEMIDHVGAAIESEMREQNTEDFYTVFKDYMVANKSSLLESNKRFLKNVDKGLFKRLFKLMIKPKAILLFVALVVFTFVIISKKGHENLVELFYWFPFASIVHFLILYTITLRIFKISRFSGIERMAFVYMVFFQILNLSRILFRGYFSTETANSVVISVVISIMVFISMLLLQLTYQILNEYRINYKSI